MHSVPMPPDEPQRSALLDSLNLLDSAPEPVFDRVTRLAARLLGVPIALFSLVGTDRQWFKSRVGLDIDQTPRDQAFCAYTILGSAPLVVEDAARDERFRDNPLVTGTPNVRFYAGVPVRTSSGHAIGTLCAIDSRPRALAPDDLQVLEDLAGIVTKEVQYRERLGLAQDRFRSIFELASIGIALVGPAGAWIRVNAALCAIVGYSEQELLGLTFRDITHADDADADALLLQRLQQGEISQYQLEKRYIRKDGSVVWVNLNVSCKTGADGEVDYYVSVIKDIQAQKTAEQALLRLNAELEQRVRARTGELHNTNSMLTASVIQQRRAESALREREAELRTVIENASDAYICLDERGAVTAWNRAAENIFGWSAGEAAGRVLTDLIIPEDAREAYAKTMARYAQTGRSPMLERRMELPAIRKDGSPLTAEVRVAALEINGRRIFSAFLHDISARKLTEAQREYESRHDPLTGLCNRRSLLERVPLAQKRAERSGQALALLFIDLDGFKAVNDTWGHDAGDRLLCEVGQRLHAAVRATDGVFRLAGDEFTVILENVHGEEDAVRIAHKLIAEVSAPIGIDGAQARVGASIGLAMHLPGASGSAEDLIRQADHWMYQAKQAGRGQVRWAAAAPRQ